MTTQAQIDAAAKAIRKYMGVFTDAEVIAKAALTAATEVGPKGGVLLSVLTDAISEAVAKERERCAEVADNAWQGQWAAAAIRTLKGKP